jgi:hypothetical protein
MCFCQGGKINFPQMCFFCFLPLTFGKICVHYIMRIIFLYSPYIIQKSYNIAIQKLSYILRQVFFAHNLQIIFQRLKNIQKKIRGAWSKLVFSIAHNVFIFTVAPLILTLLMCPSRDNHKKLILLSSLEG